MMKKNRVVLVAAFAILSAGSLWAQCNWTPTTSIMYNTGCTATGVNNSSPAWPLDVGGTLAVKGSPALIRPSTGSDTDGLKFMGTRLALGTLNSVAYGYSGPAIAFLGSFYDGDELLHLQSNTGNGRISITQANVNALNVQVNNNGSPVFTIAGGQVGINTTTPAGNYYLDVEGNILSKGSVDAYTDPGNDTTPGLASLGLKGRAAGGATEMWKLYTAAVGGGWGVNPNAFELWEYPNSSVACCRQRLVVVPSNPNTGAPPPVLFDGLGNFSIGGTLPAAPLHVIGNATIQTLPTTAIIGSAASTTKHLLLGYDTTNNNGLISSVNEGVGWTNLVLNPVSGNVGIGTTAPAYKLDVNGAIHATQVIGATYQDVAEWVPATTEMQPGTVVVLNPEGTNEVTPSSRPYDTSVAGVVSANPGVILGVESPSKAKIATTGRVKVRVDASSGAIRVGDLLVTSDKAGVAMKSQPIDVAGVKIHRPGTLIGKALEPLPRGEGEILVLLSLQ